MSQRHRASNNTKENQDKWHVAAASSDRKRAEQAVEITHDHDPNRNDHRPFNSSLTVKPKNRKYPDKQGSSWERCYHEN